jgi:HK97 family phage major capsid protein
MDPKKLAEKMKALIAECDDLAGKVAKLEADGAEDADITSAREAYDAKVGEFKALEVEAKRLKERAAMIAVQNDVAGIADAKTVDLPDDDPPKPDAKPVDHMERQRAHAKALFKYLRASTANPDPKMILSDAERDLLTPSCKALREGEADGSVLLPRHVVHAMLGKRFDSIFGIAPSPHIAGKAADPLVVLSTDSAAGSGSGSGAAQLVPPDYRAVLQYLPFDVPNVFDRVTIIPSRGGTITWPGLVQSDSDELAGVSVTWIDEGAPKPATRPQFTQRQITTHEVAAYTEIGDRMLKRSAIDLEALITLLFGEAIKRAIDIVVISGTGTGQPTGILVETGVRTVARQAAGAVGATDLTNLKYAIKPQSRAAGSYTLADSVMQHLELQVDTLGRPLFRASMANGPYDRLNGKPHQVGTNCPTLGNAGDVIFGNLRSYFLAMEEEITIAKSEHYKFQDNVTAFKCFAVAGGRPMLPRALVYLDDVASS